MATNDIWSDADTDGSIVNDFSASLFWLNGAAAHFLWPSGQIGPMPANGFFWQK